MGSSRRSHSHFHKMSPQRRTTMGSFFDNPKRKQTSTQTLSPQSQALWSILARYLLMSAQMHNQLGPQAFGMFRSGTPISPPINVLPREASAIPGIGAPPP